MRGYSQRSPVQPQCHVRPKGRQNRAGCRHVISGRALEAQQAYVARQTKVMSEQQVACTVNI